MLHKNIDRTQNGSQLMSSNKNTNRFRTSFEWGLVLVTVSLCAIMIWGFAQKIKINLKSYRIPSPVKLDIPKLLVMGKKYHILCGKMSDPVVVVEFADYQCPPCGYAFQTMPNILAKCSKKVCVLFRNFPLTAIHPHAYSAACAAEAAYEQGKFKAMHDYLYKNQTNLCRSSYIDEATKLNLNIANFKKALGTSAEKIVNRDMVDAKTLGIPGTPTFIVCLQNGQIWQLQNLSQLPDFCNRG